jgi:molybdopterin/thiamine biosynthesis adenylyltransferase/proteasome lid subunit RPN8/RPN11/rhodanese-related sulfurtransferase
VTLRMDPGARATVSRHAEVAFPEECCGFLLGTARGGIRTVVDVRRAANQRRDAARTGYLIPPEAYLEAELEAERRGLEVVGFYHSHPQGEPRPSEEDRRHALPGCSYIIVAVAEGTARAMRSWVLSPDRTRFEPEELMDDPRREPGPGISPAGEGMDVLTLEERVRYSRHMLIPEVGAAGQRRLKGASALLVGLGGLGSPVGLYLAAAGVGRLGLVDFDRVDATNLQRQIIHTTGDVGRAKLDSAREKILAVNPHTCVESHDLRLTAENALDLLGSYDVVVDGSDNFATRYLVNDACVLLGKPNVYGSIFRFEGQASVFDARRGPCYRCLYPVPPPPGTVLGCAEGGVLGVLPGIIGSIQASEALKLLLGIGDSLAGRLLLFDALAMEFRMLRLEKDPACPVCGEAPTLTALIDYDEFCGTAAVIGDGAAVPEITALELSRRLAEVQIIDVREPFESMIASIPGARLIPLGQLPARLGELDRDAELVLQCRVGVRSAMAVRLLQGAGFTRVKNLKGGILAWADDVDPTVTRY